MLGRNHVVAAGIAAALVVGNAVFVSAHLGFVHEPEKCLEYDHYVYIAMAEGPQDYYQRNPEAYRAPFCYRLLTPWLASRISQLGMTLDSAFYFISALSIFLFLYTTYFYLRAVGVPVPYARLGQVLAGLMQGSSRWYFYQYWMTDPPALFFVMLALYLVHQRGEAPRMLLIGVCALGALTRETIVIVFPYLFFHHWRRDGLRHAVQQTVLVAAVPLVLLELVHFFVVSVNRPRSFLSLLVKTVQWRLEDRYGNQLYFTTVGSLGVLFPMILLFPEKLASYARRNLPQLVLLACAYGSLLLAFNTDRLIAYALPAVLPLALDNLGRFQRRSGVPFLYLGIATVALQLLFFEQSAFFGVANISNRAPANWGLFGLMLGFWLVCRALTLRPLTGPGLRSESGG